MTFIRRFSILLVALILTACAAPKLTQEQAGSIKKIGVVSLLPQEVKYRKIGITVFNNEFKTLPTEKDAFNSTARASAERYLVQSGKYQVKQIVVDVPPMAKKLNRRSLVMSADIERIETDVVQWSKAHDVDAVIVIGENFDPERGISGLAMTMRAGFGDIRSAVAVAGLQVAGMTAKKEIFLSRYPSVGMGSPVSRSGGKPWSYRLEENLDEATHDQVVKALQHDIDHMVTSTLIASGL